MQEARLRAIGLPLDDIPHFPLPLDLPPRERGERGIKLMKARLPRAEAQLSRARTTRRPRSSSTRWRRGVDAGAVQAGTVLQWDFTDHEPWHLVLDNGVDARGARARARSPTLTLRSSFEDFVDLGAGRADPAQLMLRRRLRPKGDLRLWLRLPKIFA